MGTMTKISGYTSVKLRTTFYDLMVHNFHNSFHYLLPCLLSHYGLVTPYGDKDLGQNGRR